MNSRILLVEDEPGLVMTISDLLAGEGYQVRAEVGAFALIACLRVPGRPYKPLEFARAQEAQAAATRLAEVLCPAADADQELYVNNRNFSR